MGHRRVASGVQREAWTFHLGKKKRETANAYLRTCIVGISNTDFIPGTPRIVASVIASSFASRSSFELFSFDAYYSLKVPRVVKSSQSKKCFRRRLCLSSLNNKIILSFCILPLSFYNKCHHHFLIRLLLFVGGHLAKAVVFEERESVCV